MMTHQRKKTTRLAAPALVVAGCLAATAQAQVYETFSSFEFNSSDFVIGNAPATAHFTGGIAQRIFIPMFYHSGVRSWMVPEDGTGLITMETTATQVQLWGRDSDTTVAGLIEVFDASNNLIDSVTMTDTFQFYTFSGAIDHLTVTNQSGGADSWSIIDDFGFNIERCLSLDVANLFAGSDAGFTVSGGTPGEMTTVMYGDADGPTVFTDFSGYCATLGFDIPMNAIRSRIVVHGAFDMNGDFAMNRAVPSGAAGKAVVFQAAEQNTCPEQCVSNMVTATIQ